MAYGDELRRSRWPPVSPPPNVRLIAESLTGCQAIQLMRNQGVQRELESERKTTTTTATAKSQQTDQRDGCDDDDGGDGQASSQA